MSLKTATLALAFTGIASSVVAEECQTGFLIKKIVFDREESQAYAVMDNGVDEPIRVWADAGNHVDRFGAFDLDLPLSMQDGLQKLLNEMVFYGQSNLDGVGYAAPGMERASIQFVEIKYSIFNNADGSTTASQMEINLDRGNNLTEFFMYDGGYSESPSDFTLDGYDIDALDMYLDNVVSVLDEMQGLGLRTMCL